MNKTIKSIIFTTIMTLSISICLAAEKRATTPHHHRSPLNIDGTYNSGGLKYGNRLRVKRWKNNNIWFFLNAYKWNQDAEGHIVPNFGEAGGIIPIKNNIAVYKPTEFSRNCEVIFKFSPGKCVIEQHGQDFDCGFGHGVDASGVYKRISRRVSGQHK